MSNLVLIIGPSGVGKGTMLKMFQNKHSEFFFPISVTTRPPRETEKNGETYYFVSKQEFLQKIKNKEFLEYACVHHLHYYGTLKQDILQALTNGKNVIREIDYQGFLAIKKIINPQQLKTIFLLPPSLECLQKRIQSRSKIKTNELEQRMNSLKKEIKIAKKCTKTIKLIDGDIKKSYEIFEKIVLSLIKQ